MQPSPISHFAISFPGPLQDAQDTKGSHTGLPWNILWFPAMAVFTSFRINFEFSVTLLKPIPHTEKFAALLLLLSLCLAQPPPGSYTHTSSSLIFSAKRIQLLGIKKTPTNKQTTKLLTKSPQTNKNLKPSSLIKKKNNQKNPRCTNNTVPLCQETEKEIQGIKIRPVLQRS